MARLRAYLDAIAGHLPPVEVHDPGTSRLGGMHRHANGQEGGPNANASSLRGIVPHFALDSTVTHPKV